ncbi:hypothetical protein ASPVEDRAFT_29593 [Aspergillus versicolor CBS 583.65]|uniref:Uncharacterized protein n=1 Tax=Aspergillus versicolor CBS 583.65 TaxID=1036611 RepID=A0A1L9PNF9_ASPVE|nr:uncharacterized protein ASPVEDRAFT_29593 [Aspergillus versicolor CBS 583.65]OJJ03058.1 hypothetical protein ASPVEDRAFT_29593 [Aspergillus versicolor CBS 583.65]
MAIEIHGPIPSTREEPLYLAVVHYYTRQSGGYDRWSIFVRTSKIGSLGLEYQITDTGGKYMQYNPPTEAAPLDDNIPHSMYVVRAITNEEATTVREVAEREPRMSTADGENRATERWTFSVITELMKRGIVKPSDVEEIESMMATRLDY